LSRRSIALPVVAVAAVLLAGCAALHENSRPVCRFGSPMVLMAQSVPTATMIPCVRALPIGWHFRSFDAESGTSTFSLDSEIGGDRALTVTLLPPCDVRQISPEQSDEPGASRYRTAVKGEPVHTEEWVYTFRGGCALYRFTLGGRKFGMLMAQAARGVSFMDRSTLRAAFQADTGHPLDPGGGNA
jgi:hypothetical protein